MVEESVARRGLSDLASRVVVNAFLPRPLFLSVLRGFLYYSRLIRVAFRYTPLSYIYTERKGFFIIVNLIINLLMFRLATYKPAESREVVNTISTSCEVRPPESSSKNKWKCKASMQKHQDFRVKGRR